MQIYINATPGKVLLQCACDAESEPAEHIFPPGEKQPYLKIQPDPSCTLREIHKLQRHYLTLFYMLFASVHFLLKVNQFSGP